jgi:hypothetical protein
MLDEVEALFLLERGLQVGSAADQPGLALFADPGFEDGFYKRRPVLLDEGLDVRSLASGPSTSALGYPANCKSFAP